jgi:hypothetical protein
MFGNLKHFSTYFALILVTSIFFFSGSFILNSADNTTPPNPVLLDTITLSANPGPSNNGGSAGWAMFFDLIAGTHDITVTQMSTGSTAAASASFSVEVFTRTGTSLGGPVSGGPGSSTAGWTSLGSVPVIQGSTASGVSLVFSLPPILISAGDTVGVALKFTGAGPRYVGTGSPPYSYYSDSNVTLVTGDGRSAPFTPTGSWFASRAMTGVIRYVVNTISVVGNIGTEIPNGFKLFQNYPNPFNSVTVIEFSVPKNSNVILKVYNAQGQEVTTLANSEYPVGTYRIRWNASGFASGVYFYSMQADNFMQTKKLFLVK